MPLPPSTSSTVMPCRPRAPIFGQSWRGNVSVRSISAASGVISAAAKSRTVSRNRSISEPRSKSSAGYSLVSMTPPEPDELAPSMLAGRRHRRGLRPLHGFHRLPEPLPHHFRDRRVVPLDHHHMAIAADAAIGELDERAAHAGLREICHRAMVVSGMVRGFRLNDQERNLVESDEL